MSVSTSKASENKPSPVINNEVWREKSYYKWQTSSKRAIKRQVVPREISNKWQVRSIRNVKEWWWSFGGGGRQLCCGLIDGLWDGLQSESERTQSSTAGTSELRCCCCDSFCSVALLTFAVSLLQTSLKLFGTSFASWVGPVPRTGAGLVATSNEAPLAISLTRNNKAVPLGRLTANGMSK